MLAYPTDLFLPLCAEEISNPKETPNWDAFLRRQQREDDDDEDSRLLQTFLGYIFSGESVKHQCCMLIIYGPPDTGKSVLLDFLLEILAHHACRASTQDCLSNPIATANLLGKRLAVSSEAIIRSKDAARFRALIAGEELRVKRLFKSEDVVSHNVVFVSAMNEVGWLEATQENKKRVRVIEWMNPIRAEQMDKNFIDKLLIEAPHIILKCLKAYASLNNQRIPFTRSTDRFLEIAGHNINPVKAWFDAKSVVGGYIFHSTATLHRLFTEETGSRMSVEDFGRRATKALGANFRTIGTREGKEVRGFDLSKELARDI